MQRTAKKSKLLGTMIEAGVSAGVVKTLVPEASTGVGNVMAIGLPIVTLTSLTKDIGGAVETKQKRERPVGLPAKSGKRLLEPPTLENLKLNKMNMGTMNIGSKGGIGKLDMGNLKLGLSGTIPSTNTQIKVSRINFSARCNKGHKIEKGEMVALRGTIPICPICGGFLNPI